MTLDLENLEEQPTNQIDGFFERLSGLIPSLIEHRCSENHYGGFFNRVRTGTWMGHVVEHIALEVQTLAGMNTGFGRTRSAGPKSVYHVVFSYIDAEAGRYAAELAVRIADALVQGDAFDLHTEISLLKNIFLKNKLGPSTSAIVKEAVKRNIPVLRLNDESYIQLGWGAEQQRIEATTTSRTSNIGVDLAADKAATKRILEANGVPVAPGECVADESLFVAAVKNIGYPLVIKPLDSNHGNGAGIDIRDIVTAKKSICFSENFF